MSIYLVFFSIMCMPYTCYTNESSSTCSELCCSSVTKTPKFHHITPILKSLHWLKINVRIIQDSLSHINLSKLVNLLTSTLFLLLSPLVALLSPLVLKLQIDLSIILLLFCGTVSHLIYITLLITSLFHL